MSWVVLHPMLLSTVVNQGFLMLLMLIIGQVFQFFGWIGIFHRGQTCTKNEKNTTEKIIKSSKAETLADGCFGDIYARPQPSMTKKGGGWKKKKTDSIQKAGSRARF